MKINTNELFVACSVYDYETEVEPWVQYDSFGKIDHFIIVYPKRVLVTKKIENGEEKYYNPISFKQLFVTDYTHSFESESSCPQSLYLSGFPMGPVSYARDEYFDAKKRTVQFLIPFNVYLKERLGIEMETITLLQARAILGVLNKFEGRKFYLSYDKETAQAQINRKIYKINTPKQKKKTL